MELGNVLSAEACLFHNRELEGFGETLALSGYLDNIDGGAMFEKIALDVTRSYPPHLIKDNIFNAQEEVLEIMDSVCDWVNPYSQSGFRFSKRNGMLYPYVKRWFDWLDYNIRLCKGEFQKQQYLFTDENDSEQQLFDVNGEPILTLEGYFSGEISSSINN